MSAGAARRRAGQRQPRTARGGPQAEEGEATSPEPTFEDAQKWWSRMRRPVTFTGVPGHPFQPAVLWNAGLLFCPIPRCFAADELKLAGPPALMRELEGYETDGLHVEFSFGETFHFPDRLDNTGGEFSQELVDGRTPIIVSRVEHDRLQWTCVVFSRLLRRHVAETGAEVLVTEVRWTAHNPGRRRVRAQLASHLGAPHVVLGYKVQMSEVAFPYLRSLRWERLLLLDDRRKARLACVAEGEGEVGFSPQMADEEVRKAGVSLSDIRLGENVLLFRALVPPRESVSLRLVIPFFAVEPGVLRKALGTRFDTALSRTRSYWRRELASAGRLETPERIINDSFDAYLYQAMVATGRRLCSGEWILKTSPNNYEGLWGAHAAVAAYSMDLRGKHAWSRRVLEAFLANQGPVPKSIVGLFGRRPVRGSEGFNSHPGFLGNIEGHMAILWAFNHGWVMWAVGQHARLTGDWEWLRGHAETLALACEWIARQRRRTKRKNAKGERALSYGLLPAANAFDWGFGHMFWSDAHTYRGLREIAQCLSRIGHGKAEAFLAQAEEYRKDIVTAVTRCRDASPPVPLDDGTTIPFVPMSVEMRDYFAPDWTYVACGPLNLAWAGVIPADHELVEQTLAFLDAGRPLGEWVEAEETYQGWDWGVRTPADEDFLEVTRPRKGRAYLWRHKMTYEPGWIPQAFVFMERDDIPASLEHLYSLVSAGGQHVELRTPVEQRDGVPWTQCGQASLLWLMRNMLVREQGDSLILAGTYPRRWLAHGRSVGVSKLPTHFGSVTFRLESQAGGRLIRGVFRLKFRVTPERILVRLRHPAGALPKQVSINGKRAAEREGEWIALPPGCRELEARY